MSSIHKVNGKPNWFCAFYNPEGFRRFRTTGTENATVARTICVNVERASKLAQDNKLSNEKGLKLIRDTCSTIEEIHAISQQRLRLRRQFQLGRFAKNPR